MVSEINIVLKLYFININIYKTNTTNKIKISKECF